MLHFIASNAATCVISLALALAIAAVVVRGVRKLRRGGGCSCDCGDCGGDCGGGKAPPPKSQAPAGDGTRC